MYFCVEQDEDVAMTIHDVARFIPGFAAYVVEEACLVGFLSFVCRMAVVCLCRMLAQMCEERHEGVNECNLILC